MISLFEYIDSLFVAIKNWFFCQWYPFLYKRVNWKGEDVDEFPFIERYATTYWDDIPYGWRKAFGWQMIRDIRMLLIERDMLDHYEVHQVKEKWGSLCWYDNWSNDEMIKLKQYYEELSSKTCINCGRPAEYYSTVWVCPYCGKCVEKQKKERHNTAFRKLNSTI